MDNVTPTLLRLRDAVQRQDWRAVYELSSRILGLHGYETPQEAWAVMSSGGHNWTAWNEAFRERNRREVTDVVGTGFYYGEWPSHE